MPTVWEALCPDQLASTGSPLLSRVPPCRGETHMTDEDRPCDACDHPYKDHHYVAEYGQRQCDFCIHAQVAIPCDDYQGDDDWLARLVDGAREQSKYDK